MEIATQGMNFAGRPARRHTGARSLRGVPKNSFFLASLTILPSSINTTQWATFLAKLNSWLTTIMVMPYLASSTITSRTSLIISGSRAEVGSSNNMHIGFFKRHLRLEIIAAFIYPPDDPHPWHVQFRAVRRCRPFSEICEFPRYAFQGVTPWFAAPRAPNAIA